MFSFKRTFEYPKNFFNKLIFQNFWFDNYIGNSIKNRTSKDLNFKNDLSEKISEIVLENGFIKLPILEEDYLDKIINEYNYIINSYKKLKIDFQEHDGVCVRAIPLWILNPVKFKYSFNFFQNEFFYEITKKFFEKKGIKNFSFNNEAFFHKTTSTNMPLASEYHYDIRPCLKFWLYLNDIGIENGPMSVEKKTSEKNEKLNLTKKNDSDNKVVVDLNNCEKLTGKKGSIIIHDSNASHKANNVFENYERNIIRAHSWKISKIK